jgi:hypothetical protein
MIVGIDNGLDGGLVALSPIAGVPPIAKIPMPTRAVTYPARKKTKARTLREVCTRGLVLALESLNLNREETTVFFEHCPFHADRAETMRSMGLSAGKILAVMEAKNLKTVRILSFDWHPVVIGKIPRGETKSMAIATAKSLWPDETWTASERATLPHTGLVDAALIAEYGRRLTYDAAAPF